MAVKVTGLIQPNSGQYAIEAQHVAFSYGDNQAKTVQAAIEELATEIANLPSGGGATGDASTLIYEGQQTIKQKIEALEAGLGTTADHISYSYTVDNDGTEQTVTTNVKAILDQFRAALSGLSEIDSKISTAQGYATAAQLAAQSAQVAQLTMTTTVNDKVAEMTNMNNQTASRVQSVNTRIDRLSNIASQLQAVFEADGQFVVLSNAEYRQRSLETYDEQLGTGLSPTTIYLCYDEEPTGSSIYTLSLNVDPLHQNWGQVVGHGDYNQGVTVIAVALPRTGYQFDHWSDDNTDNPRYIVMDQPKEYIAYFEPITSEDLPENNNE